MCEGHEASRKHPSRNTESQRSTIGFLSDTDRDSGHGSVPLNSGDSRLSTQSEEIETLKTELQRRIVDSHLKGKEIRKLQDLVKRYKTTNEEYSQRIAKMEAISKKYVESLEVQSSICEISKSCDEDRQLLIQNILKMLCNVSIEHLQLVHDLATSLNEVGSENAAQEFQVRTLVEPHQTCHELQRCQKKLSTARAKLKKVQVASEKQLMEMDATSKLFKIQTMTECNAMIGVLTQVNEILGEKYKKVKMVAREFRRYAQRLHWQATAELDRVRGVYRGSLEELEQTFKTAAIEWNHNM